MDYIEASFNSMGFNDADSVGHGKSTPPPTLTPPRPKNMGFMGAFGSYKSPDKTPPRSVQYSTTAASSLSCPTFDSELQPKVLGSYEFPWKADIVPGFSGRYVNGLWIYEEAKQVKDGNKDEKKTQLQWLLV
jgi:hypothetical protein